MKMAAALLTIALTSATASAQSQTVADQEQHVRSGHKKILIGLTLAGAGALTIHITKLGVRSSMAEGARERIVLTGVGMMAAGSAVVWLGAQERRKAVRPETRFGLMLGNRSHGVQVRRQW